MARQNDDWWLEVHETLRTANDVNELFARLCSLTRALGFSYCSYGIRFPDSMVKPSIAVLDNYPASWMEHYADRKYLSVDPTVQLGAQSTEPIVWSDEVFARVPELWSDARGVGLCVGVAQSSWGAAGAYGLLSIAREAEPVSAIELTHIRPRLRWLMEVAHQQMQLFYSNGLGQDVQFKLSKREHEILRWTADGKTSWETAQILQISERTVNFHVHNVLIKLNAQNKIQAAVKAVSMGVLSAGCASVAPRPHNKDAPTSVTSVAAGGAQQIPELPGLRAWHD